MTKVFVSGSISIKELAPEVLRRLRKIVASDYSIIIGDADGVDTSVQRFLKEEGARSVVVYCSGESPRNNVGHWNIVRVSAKGKPGTREYFSAKDVRMAEDCDYGFMIWDAKSTGTLSNALELLRRGKKSLVYLDKSKAFVTVKGVGDLEELVSAMSLAALNKADEKIRLSEKLSSLKWGQKSLFSSRA